jgi:hypothetical protein
MLRVLPVPLGYLSFFLLTIGVSISLGLFSRLKEEARHVLGNRYFWRTLDCAESQYSIRIFSKEPLIIYVDSFLKPAEATHMIRLA